MTARVTPTVAGHLAADPAAPAALASRGRGPRRVRVGRPAADAIATLGLPEPGRVAIDLAVVDARPSGEAAEAMLADRRADGRPSRSLSEALGRLPAYALIGRRYVRGETEDLPGRPARSAPGPS